MKKFYYLSSLVAIIFFVTVSCESNSIEETTLESVQNKKGNLLELDEYYNARNAEHEKLMKENITYRRYYKQKVEDYFKHLAE